MKQKNKNLKNRLLSIILIHVLFLNQLIPSVFAIENLKNDLDFLMLGVKKRTLKDLHIENYDVENLSPKVESLVKNINFHAKAINATSSSNGPGGSSGFSINSTDDLVNEFTGDFTYSIPLMDVDGYPIIISYNSNVSMLSEASWVGLGWDLSLGSVTRDMRGIPDDFNGEDEVVKTIHQKSDATVGEKDGGYLALGIGKSPSFQITALGGKYTSTYLGLGKTFDLGLQSQFSLSNESNNLGIGLSHNIGLNYDSKGGIGRSQSIGLSRAGIIGKLTYGTSVNSREGMVNKTIGLGAGISVLGFPIGYGSTVDLPYGTLTTLPKLNNSSKGTSSSMNYDYGINLQLGKTQLGIGYIKEDYTAGNELVYSEGEKLLQPAYGFLHSGKRKNNIDNNVYPIMDFNRGFESDYSEEMKNLPFSIQTFDIFHVDGLGISSTVRPYRKDIGTYYDPSAEVEVNEFSALFTDEDIKEISGDLSYNPKVPNAIGVGIGYSSGLQKGETKSGNWMKSDGNVLEFENESNSNEYDNSIYFKEVGEITPFDHSVYDQFNPNSYDACRLNINEGVNSILLSNLLNGGQIILSNTINNQINKIKYCTYFNPKTVEQILQSNNVYSNSINNYTSNGFSNTPINRNSAYRKANHISEVEVIGSDGMKYNYSTPVYSIKNMEVSFSVEGLSVNPNFGNVDYSGMVVYNAGVDNTTNNQRGRSNYYDKNETPAYATSFLLNSIVSNDYVDITDNGPTIDDLGNYYKINHSMVYGGENNSFKWRFPMSGGNGEDFPQAILNRGVLGSTLDDLGNYSYGEKEIWFTKSIESKNLIAVFYLKDRIDAYSVKGEDGELDETKPSKCLDKIVLYSLNDFNNSNDPKAIQTVQFEYNYSLCPNAPGNKNTYSGNGESGKLTLISIKIYNGESYEKVNQEISFGYDLSANVNKSFSYNGIDGWGGTREYSAVQPNDVYPYATQDEQIANINSKSWKLTEIENQLGGKIVIDYEADRYGYVQYKRAQVQTSLYGTLDIFKLMKIQTQNVWNGTVSNEFSTNYLSYQNLANELGLSTSSINELAEIAFNTVKAMYLSGLGKLDLSMIPNNVLIFPLKHSIDGSTSKNDADNLVKESYFRDEDNTYIKNLLIKTHVNIKDSYSELVPSYVTIAKDFVDPFNGVLDQVNFNDDFKAIGVMPKVNSSSNYEYGYVVIENKTTGNKERIFGGEDKDVSSTVISAIQLDALSFIRQNLPDKVYGSCINCTPDLSLDWKVFFGGDMYKQMIKSGYIKNFIPGLTTLKLTEPDKTKFGGNGRVSKITYYDNWQNISSEITKGSTYIWKYKYNESVNSSVSSGVASYEGRQLLDESPFYSLEMFSDVKKKFPDETKFNPTPISELLYPIPVVGYGKIQVLFNSNTEKGYAESEFITLKDKKYAPLEIKTDIDKSAKVKKEDIIKGNSTLLYGLSQGYAIITNDFNGKLKSSTLFDKNLNVLSKTSYEYYGLGEKIPMVDRTGIVSMENVAMDYDVHADSKYFHDLTEVTTAGVNLNLQFVLPNPIPSPFMSFSFAQNTRERAFYSHTIVQHVNYSAIVKSVKTEYLGSINTAENILYDKYSGSTILTSLNDEYNDKLYSFSYPAHWYYSELKDICEIEQSGNLENVTMDISGNFIPTTNSILTPGDKVFINGNNSTPYFVSQDFPKPNNGACFLINLTGSKYIPSAAGLVNVKISQSNRTNGLDAVMQGVVTKKEMFNSSNLQLTFPEEKIISSNAIQLRDRLNILCGESNCDEPFVVGMGAHYNPYLIGSMGELILDKSFVWQSNRESNDPHGTRFNGTYSSYVPFYKLNSNLKWVTIDNVSHPNYINDPSNPFQNWRSNGEPTVFDHLGKIVEVKDAIGIYSSSLYGYNSSTLSLPIASAVNAKQQEIAFDGFEDYDYNYNDLKKCPPPVVHFNFSNSVNTPTSGVSITNQERHSGLSSLKVIAGSEASVTREIEDYCEATSVQGLYAGNGSGQPPSFVNNNECKCVKPFGPISGEKYLFSCWVKDLEGNASVSITGASSTFVANGPSIDGWRRIEGVFTPSAVQITVTLNNSNSTSAVYFDDVRIHPYLASMETVVYDPKTLLPLASHDGNNFTTFYNYDENLELVRVRVETVEGIKTISETEMSSRKFNSGN